MTEQKLSAGLYFLADVCRVYDPKQELNQKFRGIMISAVCEQTFTQEVLSSSVPVLVNFWAPWCGLCRLINPQLNRVMEEWGGKIKVVSINADENLKLANTYRLTNLPTLLLLDQNTVIHRLERFHSVDDLQRAFGDLQIAMAESLVTYSY